MLWLQKLLVEESAAQTVLMLSLVAAVGLMFGQIKIKNIGLGIAGVLFAGLLAGHVLGRKHIELNQHVLEFAREFGLILFVYTIGVQVGPGFFASLRKQGLPLNLMAGGIVIFGAIIAVIIHKGFGVDLPAAVGLFSGATTNTPSLAAAQQAMKDIPNLSPDLIKVPGMAYAVAYPFGIIGIILVMLIIRAAFKISPQAESELLDKLNASSNPQLGSINLEVRNPNLDGLPINKIPTLAEDGVVISRVMHGSTTKLAKADTIIHSGDVILAVGTPDRLEQLKLIVGVEAHVDIRQTSTNLHTKRVMVTHSSVLGHTVAELGIREKFGVNVTRVLRSGVEMPPLHARLQFGDSLTVVGETGSIRRAGLELGDSQKHLNHPQIIPMFVGIILGVLLGSIPVALPGLPAPVKLGLAGGPLVVAILLSRLGHFGPLVWYMPQSANIAIREVGIVLFLACVGIRSGDRFIPTLTEGGGLWWMAYGALITFVPLIVVALIARIMLKVNYLSLCGLLAGSMTDPPALQFAHSFTGSDAPSVSYATVYPLVMLLRVLSAQIMVLVLMG